MKRIYRKKLFSLEVYFFHYFSLYSFYLFSNITFVSCCTIGTTIEFPQDHIILALKYYFYNCLENQIILNIHDQ